MVRYRPYLLYPRKSLFRRGRRAPRWWEVTKARIELLAETDKAVKVRDKAGRILWIPKSWIISSRKLSPHEWKIKIADADWAKLEAIDPAPPFSAPGRPPPAWRGRAHPDRSDRRRDGLPG